MAVSLVATVAALWAKAPPWLAALLVLPWWVAALGVFQARERTCVALAAKGQRDLDLGPEPLPSAEREAVRAQAQRVHAQALGFALLVMVASLALRALIAT